MKMKLEFDHTDVTKQMRRLEQVTPDVARDAFKFFRNLTPFLTGNAKRNTFLRTPVRNPTIEADYAYAEVLDAGRGFRDGQMRGSQDAPRGMSRPTQQYIDKIYKQKIDKTS